MDENLEYRYEKTAFKGVEDEIGKEYKLLLPIKTKEGLVKTRAIEKEEAVEEQDEEVADEEEENRKNEVDEEETQWEINDKVTLFSLYLYNNIILYFCLRLSHFHDIFSF